MWWPDGRVYEGSFSGGRKHGLGKLAWPDGRFYDGQWHDGRQHGFALACTVDGARRKSRWEEGRFMEWMDDGNLTEGTPEATKRGKDASCGSPAAISKMPCEVDDPQEVLAKSDTVEASVTAVEAVSAGAREAEGDEAGAASKETAKLAEQNFQRLSENTASGAELSVRQRSQGISTDPPNGSLRVEDAANATRENEKPTLPDELPEHKLHKVGYTGPKLEEHLGLGRKPEQQPQLIDQGFEDGTCSPRRIDAGNVASEKGLAETQMSTDGRSDGTELVQDQAVQLSGSEGDMAGGPEQVTGEQVKGGH
mmetsp:Transcript_92019/g.163815  ORF Transcript_92019/g.163815 Transcript_92019/m.163815 type:complete len:309 (+) Transcript_92019:2-928(+)